MELSVNKLLHYCHIKPEGCSEITRDRIDFHDITFVLEGGMVYYSGERKIYLDSGDAVYLPPGTIRRREKGVSRVNYVSFNFQLSEDRQVFPDSHIKNCVSANIKKLLSLYREAHLSAAAYSTQKCKLLLSYILCEMSENYSKPYKNIHINKIIEYIDQHITERISLADIGNHAHLSKEYCSWLFRRETNHTVMEHINKKKMAYAKALITGEKMSLNKIADYLGFDDYNYFSRLFKRYVGIPPSEYK